MRDAHGGFDSPQRSVTSRENRAVNREPRAAATLLRGISDLDTLSQMSLRMEKIYDGYAFRRLHRPPVCSGTDASPRTTQKHNAAAVCSIKPLRALSRLAMSVRRVTRCSSPGSQQYQILGTNMNGTPLRGKLRSECVTCRELAQSCQRYTSTRIDFQVLVCMSNRSRSARISVGKKTLATGSAETASETRRGR